MYTLRNIRKSVGGFTLDIGNCVVQSNQLNLVAGGNGAGKTLLLKLLAFLEFPDSGDIYFGGSRTCRAGRVQLLGMRRRVSYQMQNPYLFNTGVYQNVAYGMRVRGMDRKTTHKQVIRTLEQLGIVHLRSRRAQALSGGEAQRVALARAMVIPAQVYLFDEPTANVDKEYIPIVEQALVRLPQERKATVVMTSHSTQQALSLGGNLITVAGGTVACETSNREGGFMDYKL